MGMFDWYEPVPARACPVCQLPLDAWQGKDASNLLFVWRQGEAAPVDWRVDEEVKVAGVREAERLPPSFSIYTSDDAEHEVVADCLASEGVWTETRIVAVLQQHASREGAHFTRVLWGSAPWLTKAQRDR